MKSTQRVQLCWGREGTEGTEDKKNLVIRLYKAKLAGAGYGFSAIFDP